MKIIVAGTRSFDNYALVCKILNRLKNVEVVCGEARGADALGKKFAIENGLVVHSFPADWDSHGKSAGYKRNEQMAKFADSCIVFWDGVSKGSKHMIDLAQRYGLKTLVVRYDKF